MVFAAEVVGIHTLEYMQSNAHVENRPNDRDPKKFLEEICNVEQRGRGVLRSEGTVNLQQDSECSYNSTGREVKGGNAWGLNLYENLNIMSWAKDETVCAPSPGLLGPRLSFPRVWA